MAKDHSQHIQIRRWMESDDVEEITELLHRAYAQLAELGFRYHATWQDAKTTQHRLSTGIPFVATRENAIVGTITLYVPPNVSGCEWYDRGDVACFGQFGVEPSFQKLGIGSRLLDAIEAAARELAIPNLGLDTAEDAAHLVAMYEKRGFARVGHADWEITNYRSIIMNKPLSA